MSDPLREAELDEELRTHIEMAIAERVARGEIRADAERAVRREFGNVTHVAEVTREAWGGAWLDRLGKDLRYAARGLARAPAFALIAIATLALGIGANTAMFTVIHGVLLRPLPFPEPERLLLASYHNVQNPFGGPPSLDEGSYLTFRRDQTSFEELTFFSWTHRTLTGAGEPTRIRSGVVSAGFMRVLGVNAVVGRTFLSNEDTRGNDRVAVLGHDLWRGRFGGDSAVVSKSITLDGVRHTVIGVMPPGFDFPYQAEVWTPIVLGQDSTTVGVSPALARMVWVRPTLGRLKAGVSRQAALGEFERIMAGVYHDQNRRVARMLPLADLMTADVRKSLLIFAGAVACVLLIACANVANLLLLRGNARRHEIGIRAALGASRPRLVRQMLTESAVIAILGGVAGVFISFWGVRTLLAIAPEGRIPRVSEIQVDGTVLGVSLLVSILVGLGCGMVPALIATRRELRETIGDGARTLSGGQEPARRALVVAELALAIVLLTGAGLLVKSFSKARAVDPGFSSENLYTLSINLPDEPYRGIAGRQLFHSTILDQLGEIPGVEAVGAASWVPMTSMMIAGDFTIENGPPMPRGFLVNKVIVSPGYFDALGIRVFYGREFNRADDARAVPTAIITLATARRFWPPSGEGALGKRIATVDDPGPGDWLTIVGVVDEVIQRDPRQPRDQALYQPMAQVRQAFWLVDFTYVVRAKQGATGVASELWKIVRRADPNLPIPPVASMVELVNLKLAEPRFEARLLTTFSVLALILAAIGTYGVLASDVTTRSHEIGLRMALGASRGSVVGIVLRRTVLLVLPGLAIGVTGALLLSGVLSRSLFGVKPTDVANLATVSAILVAVAIVAAVIPARRAARVDPMAALRHE
jgi:predicted permease